MAGDEVAEGRKRRRTLMMPNSTNAALEAPRTGEPEESLAPVVVGELEKDGSCGCNSNFECNICLDVAKELVVTPCGHLFCWPCLYQWLYAQSPLSECPVCKVEVLKGNITPIYGRGSEEGDSNANPDLPPRPRGNRRESLRQQLQMARDAREIESVLRQLIQNPGIVSGLPTPAGTEMTSVPTAWQSVDAAQVVLAAPQQSSSVEQLSTSSTTAVILGEPGSSRRSRRRTRRRPQ